MTLLHARPPSDTRARAPAQTPQAPVGNGSPPRDKGPGPSTPKLPGPAATTHKTQAPRPALEDLDGIGPGLAARLRERFGSDDAFFAAASSLDVAAIAAVEGVGPKRARRIVLAASGRPDPDTVLCTDAARRLWDSILADVQSWAGTATARERIALRPPAPDPGAAEAACRRVTDWMEKIGSWDRAAVRTALGRLGRLHEPRPARAMDHIVIADAETQERLTEEGLDRWVHIAGPEALRHADGLVLVLGEVDAEGPGIVTLSTRAGVADLAPEAVLSWFRQNRATLNALDDVLVATGHGPVAAPALSALDDLPSLSAVDLATAVEEERARLQARLRSELATLTLTGADLLGALEDRMPPEIFRRVQAGISDAHARLSQTAGMPVHVFVPGRPVDVDKEALREAVAQQATTRTLRRHEALTATARRLQTLRGHLEQAMADVRAWEEDFAWAAFALERELAPPMWGTALRIHDGLHLALPRDASSQRVAYRLGDDEPVALLTGANSGGKTTLLELVAQTVVLARFGLPVPAHATVPWIDEVHLVTHRRSLDAGAFESFLRAFIPLAAAGPSRLVLADEVEAITELHAAARIVGFFLRRLREHGHHGVFVTHMAPLLLEHAPDVRIDGIRSTGLDADGHLVVDRNPCIGHLAASTPELIIERIARRDPDGPWQDLLACVRSASAPSTPPASAAR